MNINNRPSTKRPNIKPNGTRSKLNQLNSGNKYNTVNKSQLENIFLFPDIKPNEEKEEND